MGQAAVCFTRASNLRFGRAAMGLNIFIDSKNDFLQPRPSPHNVLLPSISPAISLSMKVFLAFHQRPC